MGGRGDREYPGHRACPCGSGKRYRECCRGRKDFRLTADGKIVEWVPMTPEVEEVVRRLLERFREKHGRDPRPDERLFPEIPEGIEGERLVERKMIEAMEAVGLAPEFVYAFKKTGLLVTEANRDRFSEADLVEWEAAIDEFFARLVPPHSDRGVE